MDLLLATSAAGEPVAELELDPADIGLLPEIREQAARDGARLLWVHSDADLGPAGFTAAEGFRLLAADQRPAGDPLPVLPRAVAVAVLPRLFHGEWGHKQPDLEWAAQEDGALYVGLPAGEVWAGLCRVDPEQRLIDGPGFLAGGHTPEAVTELLLGACAHLPAGPVTVETWGDPVEPYLACGFHVAEEVPGWELRLS